MSEVTTNVRTYNNLFDKYWYRKREVQYLEAIEMNEMRYKQYQEDEKFEETSKKSSMEGTKRTGKSTATLNNRDLKSEEPENSKEMSKEKNDKHPSIPDGSIQSMNFEAIRTI